MSCMELSLRRPRPVGEAARRGGVNAAAATLHFSPSAVSQQLEALAVEAGAPVLERVGGGARVTEVGRVLVEHAEVLLAAERAACAAVEEARHSLSAHLTVGVFAAVADVSAPPRDGALPGGPPGVTRAPARAPPGAPPQRHRRRPRGRRRRRAHGHLDLALLLDYPDAPE